jgi:non-heme chloroperoxidase
MGSRFASLFLLTPILFAQGWTDPSPHTAKMVVVQDAIQLEVLDWGGTGRPLVLLAGYLSAHAYDDLAPKLTGSFHVYGISRRGYGGSTRTETGHTADQSANDVLKVLETLNLTGVVLAGHSWGGQDISTIGARGSERVAGLVYLNSAEDPTLTMPDYKIPPGTVPPMATKPVPADRSSFAAYRAWQQKTQGMAFPESELRQIYEEKPDGTLGATRSSLVIRDEIFAGRKKPEYAKIKLPVLALFSQVDTKNVIDQIIRKRHRDDLIAGIPTAKVVDVPGGNFYLFASHPDVVAKEITAFAAGLTK